MNQNNPEKVYPYEMVDGLPRLSYSALKAFAQSPAHFIAYKEKKDQEMNQAQKFGRMFHMKTLQPELFEKKYKLIPEDAPMRAKQIQLDAIYMSKDYYIIPDNFPKYPTEKQMSAAYMTSEKPADIEKKNANLASKKMHDELSKKNEGKVLLTESDLEKRAELQKSIDWWNKFLKEGEEILYPSEMEILEGMANSIGADNAAAGILMSATEFEKELFFKDKETGITMKLIVDIYGEKKGKVSELKSAASAHPISFQYDIKKFDYPSQIAIYIDGLRANGLKAEERLSQIIACEKKIPFGTSVHDISIEAIKKGRYDYQQLLIAFKNWFVDGMKMESYSYHSPLTGTFRYDIHESERV